MNTRLLFNVSAAIEVLTGIAMLIAPAFLIGLLLGDGLGPVGVAVARVLGIGLLSVGVAGWESQGQDPRLARGDQRNDAASNFCALFQHRRCLTNLRNVDSSGLANQITCNH